MFVYIINLILCGHEQQTFGQIRNDVICQKSIKTFVNLQNRCSGVSSKKCYDFIDTHDGNSIDSRQQFNELNM